LLDASTNYAVMPNTYLPQVRIDWKTGLPLG